jgi:hypothetical protein
MGNKKAARWRNRKGSRHKLNPKKESTSFRDAYDLVIISLLRSYVQIIYTTLRLKINFIVITDGYYDNPHNFIGYLKPINDTITEVAKLNLIESTQLGVRTVTQRLPTPSGAAAVFLPSS